ncbi:MAG: DNA mismatch repair protein MutS [Arcticibacterium sp.]
MKPTEPAKKVSPLMKQYNGIKTKYPDALLLFRVGDFYETFGADAVKAAGILGIVLTHRNNGGDRTELAGFPHHSLNTYLPKLVKAGERVAICDQLEDPKLTKTIVKRGVTELITPGVAFNDDILNAKSNNFLAALHKTPKGFGVAFLDVSTGEFLCAQGSEEYIDKLLQNFSPSEVLISKPERKNIHASFGPSWHYFYMEDWVFQEDYALETLTQHFNTKTLAGFGVEHLQLGIVAAGVALHYLNETRHNKLSHINRLNRIAEDAYVWMDRFTIKNLELFQSAAPDGVSLLEVIDKTTTPMGGRLLKRWLALPLKELSAIQARHAIVAQLQTQKELHTQFISGLKGIGDLERLISKVATAKISPREMVQLKNTLLALAPIKSLAVHSNQKALQDLGAAIDPLADFVTQIKATLAEEAPVVIGKGTTIAPGFHQDLDELRDLAASGKKYLNQMLERETARTGISSLKIDANNVFGYYIEVRNTHKDKVPAEWIRKQTLVNAERYITEELKEYEAKILGAQDKMLSLEQELFEALVSSAQQHILTVQKNAHEIAQLDCLCGFTSLANLNNYCQPHLDMGTILDLKAARHPVIEKQLSVEDVYVANDLFLDREKQQIIMITGPNMSGKSALLRQTALVVLLAQMGSFVPAASAHIGMVDKIFTRVGASDNISQGASTFMVEMNETASILNNLSERSLVLLDEIGRGTSTYDGISIAWAITEYLHHHPTKAKTLFATHYHELNEMSASFERIKNYNVAVKELKDRVIFIRTLTPGGSAHSFGIHVAKMAGMPKEVLTRANSILKKLEKSHSSEQLTGKLKEIPSDMQLSIFKLDDPVLESIRDEILDLDINALTPVAALLKLEEIKKLLGGKDASH